MRAGSPETDHADPTAPRDPEAPAGRDVIPPKDERVGLATQSERPDGWRECSGGEKPRQATTVGPPSGAPTTERTRRVNDALKATGRLPPTGAAVTETSRGKWPREGYSSRPRGTPGRAKPMDAPVPSGTGRIGGGRREGGNQTSHATRGGGGIRHPMRVRLSGTRRRARKPRRGSIAGRVASAFGRSADAAVRGCRGMSLEGHESARGAKRSASAAPLSPRGVPDGRRNAVRDGRKP